MGDAQRLRHERCFPFSGKKHARQMPDGQPGCESVCEQAGRGTHKGGDQMEG